MDAWTQKHRMVGWLGRFVAALLFVLFASAAPAQAALESVAPISGGTVWYNNWGMGGPFASAEAACRAPGTCPICGALTYVGTVPNRNVWGCMDCLFFYNPGNGTPGWNTLSGTAIPWSNAVCPVPTVNPAVRYVYNVTNGMCEREAPCPAPNSVNPATGRCEPPQLSISIETAGLYLPTNGAFTIKPSTLLPLKAIVKDQNGVAQAGKQITIAVNVQDGTGGHIHPENRPKGIFTCGSMGSQWICTLTTDYSGQAPFEFVATPISGTHTITASCNGCSNTETKSVYVKVEGLQSIPASSRYALQDSAGAIIGAVSNRHTANHYLTSTAIIKLRRLSQIYIDANPRARLYLNDASLEWGGLFDVGSTRWSSPHSSHDKGRSLDIRAANSGPNNEGAVPSAVFREFIGQAQQNGFRIGLHCRNSSNTNYCLGQPNNRHFHVDF